MKKLNAIIVGLLLSVLSAAAHEMNASSSKAGLFGLKPEYVHVLLNPLLGYGLGTGILILAAAFVTRNRITRTVGLTVTLICAASAWPVLLFGQHGYNNLSPMLDTESHQWLDAHMERAERFIYLFYATALLAGAALALVKKSPKAASVLASLTLATGGVSLGVGAWIARAGGQVSHSEFRNEETSSGATTHQHEHDDKKTDDGRMQMPDTNARPHHQSESPSAAPQQKNPTAGTNSAHQHEMMPKQSPDERKMTNTARVHQHEASTQSQIDTPPHQDAPAAEEHAHEETTVTNAAAAHAPNSQPTSGKARMPDTPEAIWVELHKHHAALAAALKAKNFEQITPHEVATGELTTALVNIVHPDHKESVQNVVDKVKRSLSDMQKSAQADDLAGVQANFKLFESAVLQLEEQMKKQ